MPFSSVEDAIAAVGRGEIVVVVDDEDRENEGDLIMAADAVTPEKIAFFLAHTSGLICVPLTPERVEQLDLPLMVTSNTEVQRTAFTVSVDYRHGTSTGISASDRAATIKALVDPHIRPSDLNRPGPHLPAALPARRRAQAGRATPRRPSIWPGRRACPRPASCARWSARTRRAWPGCPS